MNLSKRASQINESITLKLNEKATLLAQEGKQVFNLTAGQLPFRPPQSFVDSLVKEMNLLKSFQYSPVPGFPELREKQLQYFYTQRSLEKEHLPTTWGCLVSNGGKHSIYNALGALINPGDKVVLLAPYWVSYPEMVKLWGGSTLVVPSRSYHSYVPSLEDIESALSERGVVGIIINSPNNPTGTHYPEEWMKKLANLLGKFPNLWMISDEIYFEVTYFDPKPTYFYQFDHSLLNRTLVVEGISKKLASTGLRIGFSMGPQELITAMSRLQGQTTSGANSLVQRALIDLSFNDFDEYLPPILGHLRKNTNVLRDIFQVNQLMKAWYQPHSAFYYMLDLTQTPLWEDKTTSAEVDLSYEVADDLLSKTGIATVPGTDFGAPNCLRFSLVIEEGPFVEAMNRLVKYLTKKL